MKAIEYRDDEAMCDICLANAEGEITYEDGEIFVGCADCLLDIVKDPAKPIHEIIEYPRSYS